MDDRHPISGNPLAWAKDMLDAVDDSVAGEFKEIDKIHHPYHYTSGIECWDYIASHHMNYNQGNMIEYATHYLLKGNPLQDLKKVIAYAEKEIEILEARYEDYSE